MQQLHAVGPSYCVLLLFFLILFLDFFFELAHNQYFILSQESLDNITLFSIITIMSFFFLVPVAIFMDGFKFTPAFLQSAVRIFYLRAKSRNKLFIVLILPGEAFLMYVSAWFINVYYISWQGLDVRQVYTRSLLAALCFHAYQQVRPFTYSFLASFSKLLSF